MHSQRQGSGGLGNASDQVHVQRAVFPMRAKNQGLNPQRPEQIDLGKDRGDLALAVNEAVVMWAQHHMHIDVNRLPYGFDHIQRWGKPVQSQVYTDLNAICTALLGGDGIRQTGGDDLQTDHFQYLQVSFGHTLCPYSYPASYSAITF